jgi:pilus assembly protein CpaE
MTASQAESNVPVAVVVVDPDDAVRKVLVDHVRPLDDAALAVEHLEDVFPPSQPHLVQVVVLGPSRPAREAIADLGAWLERRPGAAALVVVYEVSTELLRQAMRAGIDDVVAVDAGDGELTSAVREAAERARARRGPSSEAVRFDRQEGRVVSVFCTKGGAGKTVIAVNLAVALARVTGEPVVLVDGDVQFGDVALMLQLEPSHTIADAAQAGDRLDPVLMDELLLHHAPSGVAVLAAPTQPGAGDLVSRADMHRILGLLKRRFAFVVVDNMTSFGEVALASLEDADDVLVVAGLDVMSLRSARVGLQTMRVLGVGLSKVTFVLNRANTKVGLTVGDAERALELKVDAALPSELAVAESVNLGVPVVSAGGRSRFARGILDLAARLAANRPALAAKEV